MATLVYKWRKGNGHRVSASSARDPSRDDVEEAREQEGYHVRALAPSVYDLVSRQSCAGRCSVRGKPDSLQRDERYEGDRLCARHARVCGFFPGRARCVALVVRGELDLFEE